MRWGAAGGHDGLKFGGSTGRSSRSRVIQSRGTMELGPEGTEQTREDGGVLFTGYLGAAPGWMRALSV